MAVVGPSKVVLAVPDSGASHILIRQSDAHILQDVHFTDPHHPPYAVLKAANNSELTAIGRGTLKLAGLTAPAFIFRDNQLAANLLGLAPFCDLGCVAVFKKQNFQLFRHPRAAPIMAGIRTPNQSLWEIAIPTAIMTDHIPPPSTMNRQGVYVEANFASNLDNKSYVRFVHACLGYPAPTTFLKAVSRGYINGPQQFSRLTQKMVRKHMPNTLATARGHLDKTAANQPHQHSEAVSALQRYQTRQADLNDKKKKEGGSVPLSTLLPCQNPPPFIWIIQAHCPRWGLTALACS
jgi:hypothetical protein